MSESWLRIPYWAAWMLQTQISTICGLWKHCIDSKKLSPARWRVSRTKTSWGLYVKGLDARSKAAPRRWWGDSQCCGLLRWTMPDSHHPILKSIGSRCDGHSKESHSLANHRRRHQLQVFPYGILYIIHKDHIYILAVMHLHLEPYCWKARKWNCGQERWFPSYIFEL